MATGGGYPSMSRDSEEVFESECFNCSQEGKHVEAEVFCVECGDNFCRSCLNDHNKIARLRAHTIQDKSAVKPGTTQGVLHPPTEKCVQHHGRLIDTYCAKHDVVCCSVCVSVNHKSCPDMKYIPTVASGISTSKALQDAQTKNKSMKTQVDKVKKVRLDNLENVRKQRIEALERASRASQELVNCVEDLGERTMGEISERYKALEDAINSDLDELNKVVATLEDAQSQLQKSLNNETKLFVHLKQNKNMIADGKKLVESCMLNAGAGCCSFVTDDSIEMYLKDLMSLGSFEEDSEYATVQVTDENVKSVNDTKTCSIMGLCSLDDGGLMLADSANQCLKKLDKAFQIENRCDLRGTPLDVCQTGSAEVAVTMLFEKKIQFVYFGSLSQTMSLTRTFTTNGNGCCTGIACKDGIIYLSMENTGNSSSVEVYDMSGSLLNIIQKCRAGLPLFNKPRHIALSTRSSNIFVADDVNGVIILDKSGQLIAKIPDPELCGANGVCALSGDQLLVCGRASHNVIQFDSQGRKVRTWLTDSNGLKSPRSVCFNPRTFKLVVGKEKSNKLKVFSLRRK